MSNIIKSLNLLFIILIILCSNSFAQKTFIRTNQVGFLPDDPKKAILFSNEHLDNELFSIYNYYTEEIKCPVQTTINTIKENSIVLEDGDPVSHIIQEKYT